MYNLTINPEVSQRKVQLVESLIQVILPLAADEQLRSLGKILAYPLPFDPETRAACPFLAAILIF